MNSVILGEELIVEIYFKYPPLIWTRAVVKENKELLRSLAQCMEWSVDVRDNPGQHWRKKIILDKQGGIQ